MENEERKQLWIEIPAFVIMCISYIALMLSLVLPTYFMFAYAAIFLISFHFTIYPDFQGPKEFLREIVKEIEVLRKTEEERN